MKNKFPSLTDKLFSESVLSEENAKKIFGGIGTTTFPGGTCTRDKKGRCVDDDTDTD